MATIPLTTTIGGAERGLLRFDVRRKALDARLDQFRGRRAVPVTGGTGLEISIRSLFTATERRRIGEDASLQGALNRIITNAANRGLNKIRTLSRPTYDTGAFMSNWKYEFRKDGGGLKGELVFVNPVPYALYVHRKGTPKSRTVVNTLVKPYVTKVLVDEILSDIVDRLPKAAKAALLGGS